jgi:uncharacterized protein YcnI
MTSRLRALAGATSIAAVATLALLAPSPAAAHTEADVVAVPAGSETTLSLRPTHGCDGSPTVEVAIQAPVEGATAGAVDGWTATAEADGRGNTVLEWTGGSLPDEEHAAFPVTFTAPDEVGELLLFPSVQVCENGEELSWIDGDPASDYPAPRVLVLAAGSEPATSIDDVPPDAPGRDLLTAIVDVDNPSRVHLRTLVPSPPPSPRRPTAAPKPPGPPTRPTPPSGSSRSRPTAPPWTRPRTRTTPPCRWCPS